MSSFEAAFKPEPVLAGGLGVEPVLAGGLGVEPVLAGGLGVEPVQLVSINSEYPGKLLQALCDLREQKQLCDIVINIGGKAFHAHKAVLAACSSYFMAMFTSGFKESSQSEVNIEGSAEVFELLLQFAYTGLLKITSKMAYDVLDMACYMQFTDVCKTCSTFIEKQFREKSSKVSVGDAFKISVLARNHDSLAQLAQASEKFMENNVQDLKRADVFLENASVTFLEEFLCREELSSQSEEKQVLEMVVNWLKHDLENRQGDVLNLLQKIRLGLVPTEGLKELLGADILEIPDCKALFDKVLELQTSKKSMTTLSQQNPDLFATRSTITVPISSYIGDASGIISSCKFQYYHTRQQCWKPLRRFATLPHSACYQAMIVVQGRLYAAGGLEQHRELDTDELYHDSDSDWDDCDNEDHYRYVPVCQEYFYRYHAVSNSWIRLPSMLKARNSFPLVYLDGFIYAIAGLNEAGTAMRHVERYDMAKKEWHVIAPLPDRYHRISAVAFKGNILVYAVLTVVQNEESGFKHVLHVYHPNKGIWQTTTLCEQYEASTFTDLFMKPPALFIDNDICYRVLYHNPKNSTGKRPWYWNKLSQPTVNILQLQSQTNDGDVVNVIVGEEVKQDHIPDNRLGAFRIYDEVFVNEKGFIYNTGIKIESSQSADVNLSKWESFSEVNEQSNVTCFTFDRKRLEN